MPGLPPMYALRCISQREVQPIDSTARATRGGSWQERSPWLNCPALYMRSLTASHALSGSHEFRVLDLQHDLPDFGHARRPFVCCNVFFDCQRYDPGFVLFKHHSPEVHRGPRLLSRLELCQIRVMRVTTIATSRAASAFVISRSLLPRLRLSPRARPWCQVFHNFHPVAVDSFRIRQVGEVRRPSVPD